MAFSLLLGVFLPLDANAGFISLFLGEEASAEDQLPYSDNSQNMSLLQANTVPIPVFKDPAGKSTSNGVGKKTTQVATINPNIDINIASENALVPATSPVNTDGSLDVEVSPDQISVYVVRKGDSIAQIAQMFDVSVNTILSVNGLKKGAKLIEGDVLFILPISGVEHTVTKGQTLKSIAKTYKVDVEEIAIYNGLADNSKLAVGDKLVIPGGDLMINEGGDKPASNLNTSVAKDKDYYLKNPLKNLIGYFVNPVPAGRKTQGLHGPGHRGIDIGAPTGTDIYASADGRVYAIKTGCRVGQTRCGGGYGNLVILEHPNGTRTLYAHMSKVGVTTGQQVSRGELIGYVGNTGRSTGPHIHFEVFNAKNPGSDWSWANNQVAGN